MPSHSITSLRSRAFENLTALLYTTAMAVVFHTLKFVNKKAAGVKDKHAEAKALAEVKVDLLVSYAPGIGLQVFL